MMPSQQAPEHVRSPGGRSASPPCRPNADEDAEVADQTELLPRIEKMKSVCAFGSVQPLLAARAQSPLSYPPEPSAMSDWISW